jgi:tetratricopeptide (TPR) repeat protein
VKQPSLPIVTALVAGLLLAGCAQPQARGPYGDEGDAQRDIAKAEALYQQAITLIPVNRPAAEKMLRAALGFDLYNGGAHNNLGVLLLEQNRLYDAAEEFEWARKLMPGRPEPRTNLALALDRGGKHQDALEAARAALEVSPGDLPAIQTLALIQMREGLVNEATLGYLDSIAQRSSNPVWSNWAQRQRLALETKLHQP